MGPRDAADRRVTASPAEHAAMLRAVALAAHGPRGVNPQVGAVILAPDGVVLGEGLHRGAGTAHAEVDALSHVAPGAASGATAVVTLEPCSHTGRTAPCVEALIEAGVARVVYAVDDPGVRSGGGTERLRAAGIEVVSGIGGDAANAVVADWLTVQLLGRPLVTLKWAQSLDGRAAAADGSSRWITGSAARADVHRRRSTTDAVLVGTGTVIADDPALTSRDGDTLLAAQPTPVAVGLRPIPADAAVTRHPRPLLHYATHDLHEVLADLRVRGIQTVMVEGGPTLASAFLRSGLVDEILAYVAPVLLGGPHTVLTDVGVPSIGDANRLEVDRWVPLGDDLLAIARPRTARACRSGGEGGRR